MLLSVAYRLQTSKTEAIGEQCTEKERFVFCAMRLWSGSGRARSCRCGSTSNVLALSPSAEPLQYSERCETTVVAGLEKTKGAVQILALQPLGPGLNDDLLAAR